MFIRPLDPARDFPALATLFATNDPEPPTPGLLREQHDNAPDGLIRQRLVAVDEARPDALNGYCDAACWPWELPGQFWLTVVVAPYHRHRGLGTQLAEAALGFAWEHGAARLDAEVRDNDLDSLRFAERFGLRQHRHLFEARLFLADFDAGRFANVAADGQAAGVRFVTLADLGDTEEAQRKLHELNFRLAHDVPGREGDYMPFEQFQKSVCGASWYRADGQIVAMAGDAWVGMAAVGYFAATNSMYNMFTGVEPAWRGKGIALALKLRAIACARRYGANYISTNNDSENAPMLAINHHLGYQPAPGFYRMIREPAFSYVAWRRAPYHGRRVQSPCKYTLQL
jgi:GNAT superfamily N-acetyltransferase